MRKAGRRALSLVLSVYMALSVGISDLSIASYAAEEPAKTNHLWTKVKLEDISADDSIAITMTSGGVTYVLPNAQSTKTGPLATAANVDGDTLSITDGNDSDYAWKITKNTVEVQSKDVEKSDAEPEQPNAEGGTIETSVANSDKNGSADAGKAANIGNGENGTSKANGAEKQTANPSGDNIKPSSDAQVNGDTQGTGNAQEKSSAKGNGDAQVKNGEQVLNDNNSGDGKTVSSVTENADKTNADKTSTDKEYADKTKATDSASIAKTGEEPKKTTESSDADIKENTTAIEEYYTISAGDKFLYITANNNGVRINDSKPKDDVGAKWKIDDGYLCTADSAGDVRYFGVYNSTDFRSYKKANNAIHNNIKGQTLAFYKLTDKAAAEGLLAPTASVKSGEAVESGTEITLSCATTGAKIYFNTNGTENFSEYKEPIKITEDTTIYAYSTKDNADSEKVSFAYTVKKRK